MARFPMFLSVVAVLMGVFHFACMLAAANEIESRIQQEDEAFVNCCKEAKLKEGLENNTQMIYEQFEGTYCNYTSFLSMEDDQLQDKEMNVEALLRKAENALTGVAKGKNTTGDPWSRVRIYYSCMIKADTEYELCCLSRGMDKSHKCFPLCDSKIAAFAGYGLLTNKNQTGELEEFNIRDEYLKELGNKIGECRNKYINHYELSDYLQVAIGCWRDVGRIGGEREICNAPPSSEL